MGGDSVINYKPDVFDGSIKPKKLKTPEEIAAQEEETIRALHEKAYKEGLAKAAEDSRRQIELEKERISEICSNLSSLLGKIENYRKDTVEELLPEVINLSVEIASKIVHKEIEIDKNIISYIAQEALSRVEDGEDNIVIRINPMDYDVITEYLSVLRDTSGIKNISIDPLSSIEPGGCLIETSKGEIDARIEEQIKEVADAVSTATHRDL